MSADLTSFDPNSPGLHDNNVFGLPFSAEDAALVLLPVPWEVTVSYRNGTGGGPQSIFDASMQIDLCDPDVPDGWKNGFYMLPEDAGVRERSDRLRADAVAVIEHILEGGDPDADPGIRSRKEAVNEGGSWLTEYVHGKAAELLAKGKLVGLVGGDHSTPLGLIRALGEVHEDFGVLQIDAHADLREAYEGFTYSHASIMYNVLDQVPQVSKLVQVGIRDYCDEELQRIRTQSGRITTFFDHEIKERMYEGATWRELCEDVVSRLPRKVYVSFDIDGLDPKLCPNTGTPVPGGFEASQVSYLIGCVVRSGRTLIGFDLNEVSPGSGPEGIDAITGARMLYKLCNFMVAGRGGGPKE